MACHPPRVAFVSQNKGDKAKLPQHHIEQTILKAGKINEEPVQIYFKMVVSNIVLGALWADCDSSIVYVPTHDK